MLVIHLVLLNFYDNIILARRNIGHSGNDQACAQMHLHLQVQMQMQHLHLHLHLIALRRMHLHLHLHLIHPHLHLHLHLIQMHLIGIKCETNANQMRNKFESNETVLLLHNVYFLSWFRLE